MKNRLVLLANFNNYINRKVKRYETLEDYAENGTVVKDFSCNFNPADGINAVHEANITFEETPDYALLVSEDDEILSRWFVLEAKYQTGGQVTLNLYRDTVAEDIETVLDAPAFIEKATLGTGSPFLFNSEEMNFNQIKKSETLLKDETQIPWIVGYLSKSVEKEGIVVQNRYGEVINAGERESWQFSDYIGSTNEFICYPNEDEQIWEAQIQERTDAYGFYIVDTEGSFTKDDGAAPTTRVRTSKELSLAELNDTMTAFQNFCKTNMEAFLRTVVTEYQTKSLTEEFLALDGKLLKFEDDSHVYKIVLEPKTVKEYDVTVQAGSSAIVEYGKFAQRLDWLQERTIGSGLSYKGKGRRFYIRLSDVTGTQSQLPIPMTRNTTDDNAFDVFAIPYGEKTFNFANSISVNTTKEYAQLIYGSLDKALDGSELFDLQLVPYCPIQFTDDEGEFDCTEMLEGKDFSFVGTAGTKRGVVFWCGKSKGKKTINNPLSVNLETAEDIKVSNECDLYRITSPNYNGKFDFSMAKNGGCRGFDVFFAYKPYQPYIQVAPIFDGLYGQSYDDDRGLVCGGDFSLPQTDDAWTKYQVENKSYADSFAREIQNMDVMNSIARRQAGWQMAVGTVQGASAGAFAGGNIGGPTGAVIGAVVGAGASLTGGIADYSMMKQQQEETMDYRKDQFGFQLQNIRALPTSATKISSLAPTNKIFPLIEYFTCTDEEKEAFREKMKWNGMTVGVIGKIRDFKREEESYIKAKIIRLEGLSDEYHYAVTLQAELEKGVFV